MALSINTSRVSPNRSVRRSKIRRIVIHHWNDPKTPGTLSSVVSWLTSTQSKVSAHYVVSGREVYRLVPESVVAWHAAGGNQDSIGIECDPRQQDSTYETVAELIRDIRSRHGDLPLVRHRDVKGSLTACPGTYDLARLDRLARGVKSAPAKPASKPASKPSGTGKLAVDGRFGTATTKALQKVLGVAQDGRAGADTWKALQRHVNAPYVDGIISRQSYKATELGNGIVPGKTWEYTGRGSKGSQTIVLLQKRLGVAADGIVGAGTVKALQRALNAGKV